MKGRNVLKYLSKIVLDTERRLENRYRYCTNTAIDPQNCTSPLVGPMSRLFGTLGYRGLFRAFAFSVCSCECETFEVPWSASSVTTYNLGYGQFFGL